MRSRNITGTINDKRMLSIKEVCAYIGQGETKTRQYMDEIGATRKFGSRVLFDKVVIDKALDLMMKEA